MAERTPSSTHGEQPATSLTVPPTVLIVDGDAAQRRTLAALLRRHGWQVHEAPDGRAALAVLQESTSDLVLLEVTLPGHGSFDLCRQIRRLPRFSGVPVVMLSGRSDLSDRIAGLQAGADDYLLKPYAPAELLARLHSHVRRSARERQLNPLTGLPGNLTIQQAIEERLKQHQAFAVGWVDLDNFKAYNDRYGYYAGDQMILFTARTIADVVQELGGTEGFAGHVGGDDFIMAVPLAQTEPVARELIARFDRGVPALYDEEDRTRGYVIIVARDGTECQYPLMTITVAVVPCPPGRFRHPGEIAQAAGEIKVFLKEQPGSNYMIDRRTEAPGSEGAEPAIRGGVDPADEGGMASWSR